VFVVGFQAWAYVVVTVGVISLGVLALLRIGMLRLEMPIGIRRDGLRAGSRSPRWRRADLDGHVRSVPGDGRWQVLVFADHSLRAFPDLIAGLARLGQSMPELELLIVSQAPPGVSAELREAGVTAPIVCVDRRFYRQHGIRAMPFTFVLSPDGVVRRTGLTSVSLALFRLLRSARESPISTPTANATRAANGVANATRTANSVAGELVRP
jgi:hypothetical protein